MMMKQEEQVLKSNYIVAELRTQRNQNVNCVEVDVCCITVRPSLPPAPQRPWITLSEPVKNKPVGKDFQCLTFSFKYHGTVVIYATSATG